MSFLELVKLSSNARLRLSLGQKSLRGSFGAYLLRGMNEAIGFKGLGEHYMFSKVWDR